MKIEVDKEALVKVLKLLIRNNQLSASSIALTERKANREAAINELLFMLGLTRDEAESANEISE